MARKDVPMVKPGQQQQRRKGDTSGKNADDSNKESKKVNNSPSTSTKPLRRSNRNINNQSYLSSDPNFAAFKERLDAIGLELRDILGDGNCLFRALSDQLDGSDSDHLKHREEVVRYMLQHEHDFAPFVEDDVPFAKHIDELRQPGTFAGNDAIVAFARLHKVNIIIHQLNAPAIEIKGAEDSSARQLHISYHNGDHYSSVRRLNDSTNKPVNIRLTPLVGSNNSTPSPDSKRKTKKNSANTSSGGFTDLDKIQEIIERTRCDDVELIKSTLADHDNDVASTIDAIVAILTFTQQRDSSSSASSGDDDPDVDSQNMPMAKQVPKGRSQQVRAKKAEKKLRRMQERREQLLVTKSIEDPKSATNTSGQSDIVVINSSKLNIVSV